MDRKIKTNTDNTHFRTGLFAKCVSREDLKAELNKICFDNCYLIPCISETPCPYEDRTAHIFLHGSCDIFAEQLRKTCKDYDVYRIENKNGRPIHWYAQTYYKNMPIYIDIRGATTSFEEFISEFRPHIVDGYKIQKETEDVISMDEHWVETGILFATAIINEYAEYYCI